MNVYPKVILHEKSTTTYYMALVLYPKIKMFQNITQVTTYFNTLEIQPTQYKKRFIYYKMNTLQKHIGGPLCTSYTASINYSSRLIVFGTIKNQILYI